MLPVLPILIVLFPLFRIAQHLIGLIDLLEFLIGFLIIRIQVNESNEVLSDPEKRKKYDQYGKDWQHAEQFEQQRQAYGRRPGHGWHGEPAEPQHFSYEGEGDFSDFFESLFGGGQRNRQTKFRGQDHNAE